MYTLLPCFNCATVVARLTYAASAWRGLTKASDRQRINSVINRARRHGYCPPDLPTFDELCDAADDKLFSKTVRLSHHVLNTLLPQPSTASQISDTAPTHWNCLHTPHDALQHVTD